MIAIHPLTGIGEVKLGDDLERLLHDALGRAGLLPLDAHDVLVVTQKIVSKAEGRFAELSTVVPSAEAQRYAAVTGHDARLIELALGESSEVVRALPNIFVCRHRLGLVMANAGVDQSNIGSAAGERALLLPVDPDRSAERLREAFSARLGIAPAVVVSDSFGRPWRQGVTGVAIGAAGLPALVDLRGDSDRDGRTLQATLVALGDLIAAAATLVMGEAAEGVPAALIRGLSWQVPARPAADLIRPLEQDVFR